MRTFLALELPAKTQEAISHLMRELRAENVFGIKWVEPENLHITFQFIGDTHRHDLPEITEFMEEVFTDMPSIHFASPKLQIIPAREPRLIWIGIQTNHKPIIKASDKIKLKLRERGYKPDNKPLQFHITLGRIKKRLPDFFMQKILTTELKLNDFEVTEATFYESFLRPEGPVYNKIVSYEF
ncbi:MAG TPA: RNA 2',3'-cyclic phosphodiesterase [Candidatus Cloacimonadota bacterium]|nr:RNA 2',3'-cyclic phosphodiesterase [Candidatus Cloacimonadota bacterium]